MLSLHSWTVMFSSVQRKCISRAKLALKPSAAQQRTIALDYINPHPPRSERGREPDCGLGQSGVQKAASPAQGRRRDPLQRWPQDLGSTSSAARLTWELRMTTVMGAGVGGKERLLLQPQLSAYCCGGTLGRIRTVFCRTLLCRVVALPFRIAICWVWEVWARTAGANPKPSRAATPGRRSWVDNIEDSPQDARMPTL